jgi:cytoskeletal protein CcmA (bactofilin family)
MAIFAKDGADKTETTKPGAPAGDGALSIVAAGMTVTGDIESNGVVKVEGTIEGTIRCARQVLVGRQGRVKGDIQTREAVIGGRVDGTISGAERVEIQSSAVVAGDIHAKSLVVVEGAQLNGSVRMDERAGIAPPAKAPRTEESRKSGPVAVVR